MKNIGSVVTVLFLSIILSCSTQLQKLPDSVMKKYVGFIEAGSKFSPLTVGRVIDYHNSTLNLLYFKDTIGPHSTLSTTLIGAPRITFTEQGSIDGVPEIITDGSFIRNFSNLNGKEKKEYLNQYHQIIYFVTDSLPEQNRGLTLSL